MLTTGESEWEVDGDFLYHICNFFSKSTTILSDIYLKKKSWVWHFWLFRMLTVLTLSKLFNPSEPQISFIPKMTVWSLLQKTVVRIKWANEVSAWRNTQHEASVRKVVIIKTVCPSKAWAWQYSTEYHLKSLCASFFLISHYLYMEQ